MDMVIESLKAMLTGMVGIFVVMAILVGALTVLRLFGRGNGEENED